MLRNRLSPGGFFFDEGGNMRQSGTSPRLQMECRPDGLFSRLGILILLQPFLNRQSTNAYLNVLPSLSEPEHIKLVHGSIREA